MGERPDLERLPAQIRLYKAAGGPGEIEMLQDFEAVVAYCRELEAEVAKEKQGNLDLAAIVREQGCKLMDLREENKRLRERAEKAEYYLKEEIS